jgi:hypothetical protein
VTILSSTILARPENAHTWAQPLCRLWHGKQAIRVLYAGAMLSFAPGFPEVASTGLLAGSYTSEINHTETPTNFTIAANTWYDLIISWTPTVIKYYAAVYGQTPVLIATNTINISTLSLASPCTYPRRREPMQLRCKTAGSRRKEPSHRGWLGQHARKGWGRL